MASKKFPVKPQQPQQTKPGSTGLSQGQTTQPQAAKQPQSTTQPQTGKPQSQQPQQQPAKPQGWQPSQPAQK
jgi:hypothetical protein